MTTTTTTEPTATPTTAVQQTQSHDFSAALVSSSQWPPAAATECRGWPTRTGSLAAVAAEDRATELTMLDELADAEPRDYLTPSRSDEQVAARG